jgi:hypothetical protein
MNGLAIPGAYLLHLFVCDKEMSWPHHIGLPTNPSGLFTFETARSETPDNITFRLTNVIPERIIFVSWGITVLGEEYSLRSSLCTCYIVPFRPQYPAQHCILKHVGLFIMLFWTSCDIFHEVCACSFYILGECRNYAFRLVYCLQLTTWVHNVVYHV